MNTTHNEPTILWASAESAGYGHKKITVEMGYKGDRMHFSAITTNMPGFDEATDLEGDEKTNALYSLVKSNIDEQVKDWVYTQFDEII